MITHAAEGVGCERGTEPASAIKYKLRVLVREFRLYVAFDNPFADVNGTFDVGVREFVVLADVDQYRHLTPREHFFVSTDVCLGDARFCIVDEREKTGAVIHSSLFYPADVGPDRGKFGFDLLVTAIDMIHAIDDGFAFCNECRQNQGGAGAEIGRNYTRTG